MVTQENSLPGREESLSAKLSGVHAVNGNNILPPFDSGLSQAMFGLGCFWGAERKFWLAQVYSTAVGYSAGFTPNPNYDEVCSGQTAHNEVVLVVYDESIISYAELLKIFWESHNPTQGMQQGNDKGTQYRSGIYTFNDEQQKQAEASLQDYQNNIKQAGFTEITTEVKPATTFYYAEEYHQQYLHKNPNGYCGLGGTGVVCEIN